MKQILRNLVQTNITVKGQEPRIIMIWKITTVNIVLSLGKRGKINSGINGSFAYVGFMLIFQLRVWINPGTDSDDMIFAFNFKVTAYFEKKKI